MASDAPSSPIQIEKPTYANITLGLDQEHQKQTPLLDRFDFHPRGEIQGSRTYRDGTQYRLVTNPRDFDKQDETPTWTRFVTVSPKGIRIMETIIRDQLSQSKQTRRDHLPSTGSGHLIWVAYLDNKEHIRETGSGSYNSLTNWVQELDQAVMLNVVPRSSQ